VRRLLVAASVVPSSPILVNLMMWAIRSSETSVLTTATLHNIPEYDILHSHRRENLISYMDHTMFAGGSERPQPLASAGDPSLPQELAKANSGSDERLF
jgi:hypothetical protein